MSRILFLSVLLFLFSSCIGKHDSAAQKANIVKGLSPQMTSNFDTIEVDLTKSKVHWKGTKMRGAGKHEGIIKLESAFLLSHKGKLKGGQFITNMNTIDVTDIPLHEPIPRKNLINHLKSEDFFEVTNFPTSSFTITGIKHLRNDSILVSGNLSIKNISKSIEFIGLKTSKLFSTQFTFDRSKWKIAFEGSWADKTLVDKEVELSIDLFVK